MRAGTRKCEHIGRLAEVEAPKATPDSKHSMPVADGNSPRMLGTRRGPHLPFADPNELGEFNRGSKS
jgi:hypothetical protein